VGSVRDLYNHKAVPVAAVMQGSRLVAKGLGAHDSIMYKITVGH